MRTLKTALLLCGIACTLFAAFLHATPDSSLVSLSIVEDRDGWAWLGVSLIALSTAPWGGHWTGRGPG